MSVFHSLEFGTENNTKIMDTTVRILLGECVITVHTQELDKTS